MPDIQRGRPEFYDCPVRKIEQIRQLLGRGKHVIAFVAGRRGLIMKVDFNRLKVKWIAAPPSIVEMEVDIAFVNCIHESGTQNHHLMPITGSMMACALNHKGDGWDVHARAATRSFITTLWLGAEIANMEDRR